MDRTLKFPKHISRPAKKIYRKIMTEYPSMQNDAAGKLILTTALEAYDRMKQAQEIIAVDGIIVLNRFNEKKQHPMISVEITSRNQLLQSLKALNLDLEPLGAVGSPGAR